MSFLRHSTEATRITKSHLFVAAVIVLVGMWLRVRGAQGELWLDEVWSLNTALGLQAWHEPFWNIIQDNNHPLNTWWLSLVGAGQAPWVYRLLSIATGTASIVVIGWIFSQRRSSGTPVRMLTAMLLMSVMYPFVHFGSEARGYAPMILFALLAYAAVNAKNRTPEQARFGYGIAGMLGVLSHLSILPILFALSVSFGWRQVLRGQSIRQAIHATVRLNGVFLFGMVVFVLGIVYGIRVHGNTITIGGSTLGCLNVGCFVTALDEMTRFATGGYGAGYPGLHSGFYVIVILGAVAWLAAVGNASALPLGLILLGVPFLFYIAHQPTFPHGRYFMAVFAFVPILIAEVIGELSKRTRLIRMIASLALIVFVMANARATNRFLTTGRGDYAHALMFIIKHSDPDMPITIGTEMSFQLKTVLTNTQNRMAPNRHFTIVNGRDIPTIKPTWVIAVTFPPRQLPAQTCKGGIFYTLQNVYTYWGLAGTTWGVYSRALTSPSIKCVWLTDHQNKIAFKP